MVRIKLILSAVLFVVAASICFGKVISTSGAMSNSDWIFDDSLYIDSTESEYTKAFSIERGAQLSMLVEARDDTTDGVLADSASVSIELYQAWPLHVGSGSVLGDRGFFVIQKSKANPDSTYPSSDWLLFDSLDIASMDSGYAYYRDMSVDSGVGNIRKVLYGDSIVTPDSNDVFGAFEYLDFAPDYSPALVLKLTGKANNLKNGNGSIWKIRIAQLGGTVVKQR